MTKTKTYAGYIKIEFFYNSQETMILGGAGFSTPEEVDEEWENVPDISVASSFLAVLVENNREIAEKWVSAETCEKLLGEPIERLIANGRKRSFI